MRNCKNFQRRKYLAPPQPSTVGYASVRLAYGYVNLVVSQFSDRWLCRNFKFILLLFNTLLLKYIRYHCREAKKATNNKTIRLANKGSTLQFSEASLTPSQPSPLMGGVGGDAMTPISPSLGHSLKFTLLTDFLQSLRVFCLERIIKLLPNCFIYI